MLCVIIHIILIKTSAVCHWIGRRFLKWIHILRGEKFHYNYLSASQHPHHVPRTKKWKTFQKLSVASWSSWWYKTGVLCILSINHFQIALQSFSWSNLPLGLVCFLHRLLSNLLKIYAFFLKKDFHWLCAACKHGTWETHHATK